MADKLAVVDRQSTTTLGVKCVQLCGDPQDVGSVQTVRRWLSIPNTNRDGTT